jgi:hypothetical protein
MAASIEHSAVCSAGDAHAAAGCVADLMPRQSLPAKASERANKQTDKQTNKQTSGQRPQQQATAYVRFACART